MPSFPGKPLAAAWRTSGASRPTSRKSNAGCKPWAAIVIFKTILLCALCNLSDDQVEYQMRDRLCPSCVSLNQVQGPCGSTRERLSQAGLIDALFEDFDGYLKGQGYQARVARSSLLRLSQSPSNVIAVTKTSRSSAVRPPRPRRMRAGRRSTASVIMVTRTTSASTVGTN